MVTYYVDQGSDVTDVRLLGGSSYTEGSQALRRRGAHSSAGEIPSRTAIRSTQDPHPVPAAQPSPTSSTVLAPSAMHWRTCASVTALQMQTYMAASPPDRMIR
jgi:hypothetical protein